MAYGFAGSLKEFEEISQKGDLGKYLSTIRQKTGGFKLSLSEESVWENVGKTLTDLFSNSNIPKQKTFILAEYDIPGHFGRCDAIILGRNKQGKNHALLIEIKLWREIQKIRTSDKYIQIGSTYHLHPCEQALGYRDRLKMFHEMGNQFNWKTCILLGSSTEKGFVWRNSSSEECLILTENYDTGDPPYRIALSSFAGGLPKHIFEEFCEGKYKQQVDFGAQLQKRLPAITSGVSKAISGRPLDLTESQQEIVHLVQKAVESKEKTLIILRGDPGCGKTVIGLTALIHALSIDSQTRVALALRNNRLCQVVRSAIDDAAGKRIGNVLVQYVKGGGPNAGIQPKVAKLLREDPKGLPIYDLLIIDEAHRIPHRNPARKSKTPEPTQLESVLYAGNTVVALLDEGQILNPDDSGNCETFISTWNTLFTGERIILKDITEQHRLPPEQNEWLENFLNCSLSPLPLNYEFQLFDSLHELLIALEKKSRDSECGLLASYTLSDGRKGNTLRVKSPRIHWLMEKEEYENWWRNSSVRHRFDRCASVYGCQGFELDYAGVIWGKDLRVQYKDNKIRFDLCSPHEITDNIGQAFGKKLRTLANEAQQSGDPEKVKNVVKSLINRYRILLSRGRKGTYLYCEDAETRKAIRAILMDSCAKKGPIQSRATPKINKTGDDRLTSKINKQSHGIIFTGLISKILNLLGKKTEI